jgi:hypothetical protein
MFPPVILLGSYLFFIDVFQNIVFYAALLQESDMHTAL